MLFRGVDFTLNRGDLVGLAGPSGSGKTTLLTILAGWTTPLEGELDRSGVNSLTWVPQNPVGVHQRTALDHIVLALLLQGATRPAAEDQARDALTTFGIQHAADRPMGTLSGGEAQRLMFARAALMPVDLLLVDEPTAQLDPHTAGAVAAAITALAATGRAVVIASHDPRVLDLCPRRIDLGGTR